MRAHGDGAHGVTGIFSWPRWVDSWPLSAIPTMLRRRLSDAAGVDAAGERGRDGVELGFQAAVVGAGPTAVHQVPDGVSPFFPGLLDLWGLGGFDGTGAK